MVTALQAWGSEMRGMQPKALVLLKLKRARKDKDVSKD